LVLEAPMAIFFASAVSCFRAWRRIAVWTACIAIFLGTTAFAGKSLFQSCDDEDNVPAMLDVYRSGHGFSGTNEYEPIGADNALVATGLPQACLVSYPTTVLGKENDTPDSSPAWDAGQGSCDSTFTAAKDTRPEHLRMIAATPHAGYMVLRLRSYPAWRVSVNGRPVSNLPQRKDGLMAVPVQQGPVYLTVDWATTPDVLAGRWLSGLTLILLTGLCLLGRKLARRGL
jgi:hypothetical protein